MGVQYPNVFGCLYLKQNQTQKQDCQTEHYVQTEPQCHDRQQNKTKTVSLYPLAYEINICLIYTHNSKGEEISGFARENDEDHLCHLRGGGEKNIKSF